MYSIYESISYNIRDRRNWTNERGDGCSLKALRRPISVKLEEFLFIPNIWRPG